MVFEMDSEIDWYEEFVYPASTVIIEESKGVNPKLITGSTNSISKKDFLTQYELNKKDIILPGKDVVPDYCHRPKVAGISTDFTSQAVVLTHCGTVGCPHCYRLWEAQRVFEVSVLEEAYCRSINKRPSHFTGSILHEEGFTLEDLRHDKTRIINSLKKQGINAGVLLSHYFRINANVAKVLRKLTQSTDSQSHWMYLRDDWKQGHISEINKALGTAYTDFTDCLHLAPHVHGHLLPGTTMITGNSEMLIKKQYKFIDGVKEWTLNNLKAVIANHFYLISHTGQLSTSTQHQTDSRGKTHRHNLKTYTLFGELHNKKPTDFLPIEEVNQIRLEALEIINEKRNRKLKLSGDTLFWDSMEERINAGEIIEEKTFIPMSRLRIYSFESSDSVTAFISSARLQCPENADYIQYLIETFNRLHDCKAIPGKYRHLWSVGFDELPKFITDEKSKFNTLKLLDPCTYNIILSLFKDGLKSPPSTFKTVSMQSIKYSRVTNVSVDWGSVSINVNSGSSLLGLDDIDIESLCSKPKERIKKPDLMEGWL